MGCMLHRYDIDEFPPLSTQRWEPVFKPVYLVLWFAVAAVLLKVDAAVDVALGRSTTIFGSWTTYVLQVDVLVLAAAVIGAAVLLWSSRGDIVRRFQPGHWILMNLAIVTLAGKLLWFVGRWQLSINQDAMLLGVAAIANVLGALLYGFAAVRLQAALPWKASFWSFTTLNVGVALAVVLICVRCNAGNRAVGLGALPSWALPLLLLCAGVCVVSLVIAILSDHLHGTRRHWLHWLGVASIAASVLLPALWQVAVAA